jgi:hypothetical protein
MQPLIEWKDIKGFEGLYQISNEGQIRSLDRHVKGRNGLLKGSIKIQRKGLYPNITLFKNGEPKICNVHRLVALHFIDNPNNKPEVNHIDGNRENNHYLNLEWCTRKENALHSTTVLKKNVGNSSGTAILNEEQVKEIKLLLGLTKMKLQEIGDLFGVSNHVIHKIKRGKNWAWLDEKGVFTS